MSVLHDGSNLEIKIGVADLLCCCCFFCFPAQAIRVISKGLQSDRFHCDLGPQPTTQLTENQAARVMLYSSVQFFTFFHVAEISQLVPKGSPAYCNIPLCTVFSCRQTNSKPALLLSGKSERICISELIYSLPPSQTDKAHKMVSLQTWCIYNKQ